MEERSKEPVPASAFVPHRIYDGKRHHRAESVAATKHPDSHIVQHTIQAKEGDKLAVGLSRIRNAPGVGFREYVFSVYKLGEKGKKQLLEVSGEFSLNSWNVFHADGISNSAGGETAEIQYVLKPKGLKSTIVSIIERWKGVPPYYKEFAFMTPGIIHRRETGEPNVILISFDTLRPDHLGCFGYSRATSPNIDGFAEQNTLFTQAISTSPWTFPAHSSLMTGLYPSAHLTPQYFSYAEKPMATVLRDNGYYTIAITGGGWVASTRGFHRGFDRYIEFDRRLHKSTEFIFGKAIDWLEDNGDSRFFMFLHNYEVHDPYEHTSFLGRENEKELIEKRKALYDGDILYMDTLFGKLVEKLRSLDLLANSIIIVVSDHGDDFYDHFTDDDVVPPRSKPPVASMTLVDHGHSVYDEVLKVLLIFHFPDDQPQGRVIENQVSLIDVMPTLMDYLGIGLEAPVQGTSLLPLIRDGSRLHDPPAISEFTQNGPEQKSVRMNGYKYMYTKDPKSRKKKITYKNIPSRGLFDLEKDPKEKNNMYTRNSELAKDYHEELERNLEESSAIMSRLQNTYKSTEGETTETPQDVVDALKALGYIQ